MNWELQLAAAMAPGEVSLLTGARKARELAGESRYGAALGALWKLLLAAARRSSPRQRAFVLLHMGHVYRHWMIEVAFKFFRDARRLSRESGFAHGEMVAESSLGQLYLDWGDSKSALPRFERCLALARDCAGAWWQRDVLAEVVECLETLGETERARTERRRLDELDAEVFDALWGGPESRDDAGEGQEELSADAGTLGGGEPCRY